MEATSKTAKGQIGEMSSAFVELSRVYQKMTDQERQSPVGQALSQSLKTLKQRTIDAKNELQGLENQLRSIGEVKTPDIGGGFLGGKINGMLQVFGGNLMTKGASMLAGLASEMGDMIKQGVELAKQGEGIRIAFERLGRGDILDGLREATHGTVTDLELMKAAVKFNDFKLPLEELGTMLAFAQQKAKDTGQSVDYMVDSIVTGLGRKSLMILDNLGLSAAEIKEKMAETGDMTKAVGAIIREQMESAGEYIETAVDRAAQANVNLQNKMEELGRKFGPLQEASNNLWTSMKIGIMDIVGGPLTNFLNKLTEAGRLANAYGVLGGNGKVGRMTANLAGASEGNRQSIYQQQQQKFWQYINPREQQIKDIRAWQRGERGDALQSRINAITEKYGSLDATKIQAEVDAAKKMLADYQQAAKTILNPVKADIDTSGAENNVDSLKKKLKDLEEQRKKAIKAGDTELAKNLTKQINQTKTDIRGLDPKALSTSTSHKTTPQETAANKIEEAERTYAETLQKAAIRMEVGLDSALEGKKKELAAQERLFDAYNDAYATYKDSKYKKASSDAADNIKALAAEVKSMTEEQEATKKAARELEQAQKKLADAENKLAEAQKSGSATTVYKAQQDVVRQRENVQKVKYEIDVQAGNVPDWLPKDSQVTMTVNVDDAQALEELRKIQSVTIQPKTFSIMPSSNEWLDTLNGIEEMEIPDKEITVTVDDAEALEKLKKLQGLTIDPKTVKVEVKEETGKTNFENLQQTIQAEVKFDQMKVDEATLHTILKDSIQRGINTTSLHLEPISEQIVKGIDVPETTWQKILDDYNKLREQIGEEPIDIDFNTGNKKEKKTDTKGLDKFNADFSKVTGGVSSIVSGIQSMGVEIPKEIQSVLGVLSGISSIMTGITAILTLIQLDTKVTAAATVADAAIPFAHGGIVPHAANGYYVPGRSYSGDNTPIMANAGELVLNTSSQQTLANDIMMAQALVGMIENMYQMGSMGLTRSQQSGMSSELGNGIKIDVIGKLQGEDMVLMCDRWGRRTGKGELLFAKNL